MYGLTYTRTFKTGRQQSISMCNIPDMQKDDPVDEVEHIEHTGKRWRLNVQRRHV